MGRACACILYIFMRMCSMRAHMHAHNIINSINACVRMHAYAYTYV